MKEILWINGTINSGKSTLAKELGKSLKRAVIELDSIYEMLQHALELPEIFAFNHDALPEIIEIFHKRNVDVIVVYPITKTRAEEFLQKFPNTIFITLDPGIAVVTQQRGDRVLSEWEVNRIHELYAKGINDIGHGIRITTERFAVDDVINQIDSYKKLDK